MIVEPLSSDEDDELLIGNENVIQPEKQNDDNKDTQHNSHPNSQASNNTTVEVVLTTTTTDTVPITTPLAMKWKKTTKERALLRARSATNLEMIVTWILSLSIRRKPHL